jgi:hypothetical protein
MATLEGKHQVAEIDGVRCTICGKGLTEERKAFLADLLTKAGYEVKAAIEVGKDGKECGTWVIGVTDILFNPVIRVYQQKLFLNDGTKVTPAIWEQKTTQTEIPYWQVTA